jgi:putative hydrolase of the HAD superfamily
LIKGVFFDLYGTLINAEHLFFDIAMEISIETNYDVERVEKIIKQKYNKIFNDYHNKQFQPEKFYYEQLFYELKKELILRHEPNGYVEIMYDSFKKLNKFEDSNILEKLKGKYFISIVTNADADFVRDNVKKNELYYDDLLISDEIKLYKPDKLIFEIALKRSNLSADEVIFVGDNYKVDYLGSLNYGIKPVLIDRFEKYDTKDIISIKSLDEIEKYI